MPKKKRTNKDNEKQVEKFVSNLVKGMSQRQAYYDAFPNSKKWKPETIDSKASILFKNKKVKERYNELLNEVKKNIDEKAIMSATERREWLTKVIKGQQKETMLIGGEETPVKAASLSDKMKAIDILNKMDGEYVTKIAGNIGIAKKLEELL